MCPEEEIHVCNPFDDTPASESASAHSGAGKPDGRVAFVTGGTRGIGAAICHSLMGQGATVAAGYSGTARRQRPCSAELSERGDRAAFTQLTQQRDVGRRPSEADAPNARPLARNVAQRGVPMKARGLALSRHLCGP